MNNVLVICGPTCSGKSELALFFAKKYNGEIISADSMQIYSELNIGTAKLTDKEKQNIPHYLISIINPNETFSVAEYKEKALKCIDDILSRNKLPIICGGTGLYISALLYNYDFANVCPNEEYRNYLIDISQKENGKEELYKILLEKEPTTEIHINNVKRVIRRLEVLNSNIVECKTCQTNYNYTIIQINPDRARLYELINKRVDKMFELGLEDEVLNVTKKYSLSSNSQSMKAIGYREFFELSEIEEIKSKIKQDTRNYAKRQITWFKRISPEYIVDSADSGKNIELVL